MSCAVSTAIAVATSFDGENGGAEFGRGKKIRLTVTMSCAVSTAIAIATTAAATAAVVTHTVTAATTTTTHHPPTAARRPPPPRSRMKNQVWYSAGQGGQKTLNSLTAVDAHDRPLFNKLCAPVLSPRIFVRL